MSEYPGFSVITGGKDATARLYFGGFDGGCGVGCNTAAASPAPTLDRTTIPFKLSGPGGPIVACVVWEGDRTAGIYVDHMQIGPVLVQNPNEARWVFEDRVRRAFQYVVATAERIGQRSM